MIHSNGLNNAELIALLAGVSEMLIGLSLLYFRQHRWPLVVSGVSLALLLFNVAIFSPSLLVQAFNPVTTNIMSLSLCLIAWKLESRSLSEDKL